jgi:DNA primase
MMIQMQVQVVMVLGSPVLRVVLEADLFNCLWNVRELTITMVSNYTKKLLETSASYYQKQLQESEEGHSTIGYLKARGLTKSTVDYFRLGLVKDPLPESGHDFQTGRLSMPYITQTGIVQMRFRALPYDFIPGNPEPSPKVKGEAGVSTTIYNAISLMYPTDLLAVCEGEPDTWSVHQVGIPAIGIAGANAWQPVYGRILRYRRVVVIADNDDHGEGMKFAENVQQYVRGSRIIVMEKGHDANSFMVEYGEEALRKKILK